MQLQAGMIIKSTAALNNTYFESATVVITEYNTNGAVGFVTNKPFPRKLNELDEFKSIPSFPLYEGGPVDQEHLFFIHKRPELINGGTHLVQQAYFGGDFKEAVSCIEKESISTSDIKVFVGYCGWDANELEEEIKEGSWMISADAENILTP